MEDPDEEDGGEGGGGKEQTGAERGTDSKLLLLQKERQEGRAVGDVATSGGVGKVAWSVKLEDWLS